MEAGSVISGEIRQNILKRVSLRSIHRDRMRRGSDVIQKQIERFSMMPLAQPEMNESRFPIRFCYVHLLINHCTV